MKIEDFIEALGADFYTGVPDSLLKPLCNYLMHTYGIDKNHHLIVNEVDGKIVSSCVCVIIPNLTRGIRPYALIENVVTHSDYRGMGHATACLDFARDIAVKADCYKIMLLTGSHEASTLRFYERAGYNRTEKTGFIQRLE